MELKSITCIILTLYFLGAFGNDDESNNNSVNSHSSRSWKWEAWEVPSGRRTLSVYVFNITNPEEALNGRKPELEEIGPYVYEETIERTQSSNTIYSFVYTQTKKYTFVPELSYSDEDVLINTINVPLFAAAETVSRSIYPDLLQSNLIGSLLSRGQSMILTEVPVGELIMKGYDIGREFQSFATLVPNFLSKYKTRTYSVFGLRNGATEEQYHVGNGLLSSETFGDIYEFNGKSTIAAWNKSPCWDIRGTDGSSFTKSAITAKKLQAFESNICRSINYVFDGESTFRGINSMNFKYQEDLLDDPRVNHDNACFCTTPGNEVTNEKCVLKGAMDISTCLPDLVPLTISYPRFYDAADEYKQFFPEIEPDSERPKSYVTVEPNTGVVLEKMQRIQYNLRIRPIESVDAFKMANNMLFPLLWAEEHYEIDSATSDELFNFLNPATTTTTPEVTTPTEPTEQSTTEADNESHTTENQGESTERPGESSDSTEPAGESGSTEYADNGSDSTQYTDEESTESTTPGAGVNLESLSLLVILSVYLSLSKLLI